MPLLDHFHSPLAPRRHWESFHVNWAGAIADALNETLLPEGYFAEEHAQLGPWVEIDVATFTDSESTGHRAGGTATLPPRVWVPPAPAMVAPAAFPDAFEVLVFENEGGARLVAAIELVSPGNKDRTAHRQAFVVECASYLCRGISLIVIDIVTSRRANLHNEILRVLGHDRSLCHAGGGHPLWSRVSAGRPRGAGTDRDVADGTGNRSALAGAAAGAQCRVRSPDRFGGDLHRRLPETTAGMTRMPPCSGRRLAHLV